MLAFAEYPARNVAFLSALMDSTVPFVACDNPHANRLTLHILAAVAEAEALAISHRTKAALAAYKARGGKLGFALDFAQGLADALDKFQTFLREVTKERQNQKLALNADQAVEQRNTQMRRMSTRKFLLFFESHI